MTPKVSFVMPTYNRAYVIKEAIASIQAQTLADWELLVIDDASTDDTEKVVNALGDPRIRYYRLEKNSGAVVARNYALDRIQGEWVSYLDSDDELYPEYLAAMLSAVEQTPGAEFAFSRGRRIMELYAKGTLVASKDKTDTEFPEIVTTTDIVHRKVHGMMQGFMHSRRAVEAGVRFDPQAYGSEDWELMLTLCEKYPNGFVYVPKILFTYRMRFGADGIVGSKDYAFWAPLFEYIYQKHKNDALMVGQTWYPDRVNKWQKLAQEFEQGLLPPYGLYYFQEYWDKKQNI